MKGLILSGGYGTRLRPLTYSQQKQLIPLANKAILFYAIEDLIEAGIKEIAIIVGPNKEQVIETVNSAHWNANIEFICQDEPEGLAHTILISEHFLDEEFVMYLGDNILKDGIVNHAKKFKQSNADSLVLITEVENPQRFGVVELEEGQVKRLVEKPRIPPSNYALVGIYFFKPIISEACKNIKPSWRNELEITDAIQWLVDNGYKVNASIVEGWWKDTGRPEDILEANRLLLEDIEPKRGQMRLRNSRIIGRVRIDSAIIVDSVIKGPCVIGENCAIINSYIGSYTSIGNDCKIIGTEIEDSAIMDGCRIVNAERITESLIGRDVRIFRNTSKPKGHRFIIGDNSEIRV